MIICSVFTVSCPSCGAPLALTYTLASRSDEPRADSSEVSRCFPSFLRKMTVFGKTESVVMMPLCSAFTAADTETNALAAGNITEMSLQRVGTNVALHEYALGVPSSRTATLMKTRRSSVNNCRSCVCQSCVELTKEQSTAHA